MIAFFNLQIIDTLCDFLISVCICVQKDSYSPLNVIIVTGLIFVWSVL